MNTPFTAILVIIGTMAVAFPASRVWGQGVPSQSDIERSLNSGAVKMRGVSPGAIPRFPTEQQTAPVSTTAPSYGRQPRRATAAAQAAPARTCMPKPPEPGTISLPHITFEFNSSVLRPEAREVLRNLGNALNQGLADQQKFVIEGHTDAAGSAEYNLNLSRERAEAAKTFLVDEMKVAAARLQVVGKGFSELANPCNPRAAENRRLVVINQSS